jgi:hypothetical protein
MYSKRDSSIAEDGHVEDRQKVDLKKLLRDSRQRLPKK